MELKNKLAVLEPDGGKELHLVREVIAKKKVATSPQRSKECREISPWAEGTMQMTVKESRRQYNMQLKIGRRLIPAEGSHQD